ncbi:MAG: hypothetical protein ACJ754_27535 [Pyrinomonadaceae bacterium]
MNQPPRVRRLEELLGQAPSADVRRIIYESIFRLAIKSKNDAAAGTYSRALRLFDPNDSALLSQTATLLADKSQHLAEALRQLRPLDGRPFNLSSLKGKVVLINFWYEEGTSANLRPSSSNC